MPAGSAHGEDLRAPSRAGRAFFIHVVWSISTPILIAEGAVASDRSTQPWLRMPGLVITTLLFVLGCVATASFSLKGGVSTRPYQSGRAYELDRYCGTGGAGGRGAVSDLAGPAR